MSETRIPVQKRSIEKRNKIIEKGFELMCENGYYQTSTTDIAEFAGVSTGIVYQYFNDKKEIFIEGVKNYANNIMYPMVSVLEKNSIDFNKLDIVLETMIDNFIKKHTISEKAHEELMAMSHLDKDVSTIFKNSEFEMTKKIDKLLKEKNIFIDNSIEKIHIIFGIIDNLCHEIVYHNHTEINYDIMKKEVIKLIINLIKK